MRREAFVYFRLMLSFYWEEHVQISCCMYSHDLRNPESLQAASKGIFFITAWMIQFIASKKKARRSYECTRKAKMSALTQMFAGKYITGRISLNNTPFSICYFSHPWTAVHISYIYRHLLS